MWDNSFTAHDRIIKSKIDLNKDKPFFAFILMNMNIEQSKSNKDIPTMGVNKFGNLYWNEEFVKTMTQQELDGVLAHEAMHMVTLTFQRQGTRDMMLWNMATDAVINWMLLEEHFQLPKLALLPQNGRLEFPSKTGKKVQIQIAGKTAEEVYDDMMKHITIIKVSMCGSEGSGDGSGDGKGDGKGGYKGQIDSHLPGDKDSEGKSTGQDKGEASDRSNESNWKKKAMEAATAAKARGTLSANMTRMLEGILEPKIDWRKKLYHFMTKDIPVDFTMSRPGRRFYTTGVYYPSVIRENLEIICGCDCSGSISYGDKGTEGCQFISEAVGIGDAFPQLKMRMIWWSTYVDPQDDIMVSKQTKDKLIKFKPHGGGGTEMSCFAKYVEEKNYRSRIYVILTDGFIESRPKVPKNAKILFVLSKGGSAEHLKAYGEVCSLGDIERD